METEYKIILWLGIIVIILILGFILYAMMKGLYKDISWYFLPWYRDKKIKYIQKKLKESKTDTEHPIPEQKIQKWNIFLQKYLIAPPEELPNKATREALELTKDIKTCIDNMIDMEILLLLAKNTALKEKINILNIDTNVSNIARNVYKGLHPEVLNSSTIVTKEYLTRYIVIRTNEKVIETVSSFNSVVR